MQFRNHRTKGSPLLQGELAAKLTEGIKSTGIISAPSMMSVGETFGLPRATAGRPYEMTRDAYMRRAAGMLSSVPIGEGSPTGTPVPYDAHKACRRLYPCAPV